MERSEEVGIMYPLLVLGLTDRLVLSPSCLVLDRPTYAYTVLYSTVGRYLLMITYQTLALSMLWKDGNETKAISLLVSVALSTTHSSHTHSPKVRLAIYFLLL